MSTRIARKAVGQVAADLVRDGMIIGLGSGTTASFFIDALIKRVHNGLKIECVSSSKNSYEQAKRGKIPIYDINEVSHVDITFDGADEIDPQKRMIKGGGGAHVREKILATSSEEMVVIIDESKLVPKLATHMPLPVEVLFFGSDATKTKIEKLGFHGKWRIKNDGDFFITDTGNLIYDISYGKPPEYPEQDHDCIIHIPGVVDTGYFFGIAGRVLIGHFDGHVEMKERLS